MHRVLVVIVGPIRSNAVHVLRGAAGRSRLTETPSEHIDSHFRPMHLLCEFGRIRYDFVGDLKVQADLDYISDKMGFPTRFSNFSGVHQYTR